MITEIERVLALPPAQALAQLRASPEGQWLERKSSRTVPRDLAVPLVAMANAEGGYLVVGADQGKAGPLTERRANAVRQVGVDFTEPPVRYTVVEIPEGAGSALVLRVEPGRRVHATVGGDCYLRIGDESRRLGFAQRQQLEYERGTDTFEGLPVARAVSKLDRARLAAYQKTIGSSSVDLMLRARDLLTEDDEPTVAAWLLFADHPQAVFPQAHVRLLRYAATYRGVGADLQLYDDGDVRLDGPLLDQVAEAERIVEQWLPKRRALTGGRFGPVPLLPHDAWLEGVVNAVIHRSYAWAGDHIRVEVFPDRVEITSPGGLPGFGDAKDPMGIRRYARNPRIARVAAELGVAQELGEGIRRMFSIMREAGLNDPVYAAAPNQVRLALHLSPRDPLVDGLAPVAAVIVQALRQAATPLGTSQVARLAAVSAPTAQRYLKGLQAAGVVVWRGSSPRDPRATWALA